MHDWRNPERVSPWKPRQVFRLTAAGVAAIDRYRDAVRVAQGTPSPREALERAKLEWAGALGLRPADGILLDDIALGHACLAEMRETLQACDMSLRDARGGLDRMLRAGLIETGDGASSPTGWRGPAA